MAQLSTLGGIARIVNKKYIRVVLLGAIVVLIAFSAFCWVSIVHMVRARHVARDLDAVVEQVYKQQPSIERSSEFVQKLHTINTDYASAEVKQALSDYTAACEAGLAAWKAGSDRTPFEQKIREQSLRLKAILKIYQ